MMSSKGEFNPGAFIGQYFGAGGSCVVAQFIVEKNGLPDFRAATQDIPDTVTVFMACKPFKVGKPPRCDYNDIRIQVDNGFMFGIDRVSNIHTKLTDFFSEPVGNRQHVVAPFCLCRQNNLTAETVKCLEKNDLMTTQCTYPCCLKASRAATDNNYPFTSFCARNRVRKGFLPSA